MQELAWTVLDSPTKIVTLVINNIPLGVWKLGSEATRMENKQLQAHWGYTRDIAWIWPTTWYQKNCQCDGILCYTAIEWEKMNMPCIIAQAITSNNMMCGFVQKWRYLKWQPINMQNDDQPRDHVGALPWDIPQVHWDPTVVCAQSYKRSVWCDPSCGRCMYFMWCTCLCMHVYIFVLMYVHCNHTFQVVYTCVRFVRYIIL